MKYKDIKIYAAPTLHTEDASGSDMPSNFYRHNTCVWLQSIMFSQSTIDIDVSMSCQVIEIVHHTQKPITRTTTKDKLLT